MSDNADPAPLPASYMFQFEADAPEPLLEPGESLVRYMPIEQKKELCLALLEAQRYARAVEKDARNTHSNYDYASAEAIITEARGALLHASLVAFRRSWLIPDKATLAASRSEDAGVYEVVSTFHLLHPASCQMHTARISWPAVTRKGTPIDKAVSAALTTAFAYWLRDLLMLPRVDHEMNKRNDQQQRRTGPQSSEDAIIQTLTATLKDKCLARTKSDATALIQWACPDLLGGMPQVRDTPGAAAQVMAALRAKAESVPWNSMLAVALEPATPPEPPVVAEPPAE